MPTVLSSPFIMRKSGTSWPWDASFGRRFPVAFFACGSPPAVEGLDGNGTPKLGELLLWGSRREVPRPRGAELKPDGIRKPVKDLPLRLVGRLGGFSMLLAARLEFPFTSSVVM